MLQIVGTITTTSHVHQTSPAAQVTASGDKNRSQTMKTFVWSGEKRHLVPYITSNSIRGLMRRHAAKRVMEALNKPISRELFHNLTRGASARGDIGMQANVTVVNAARENVFAGVFGGGAYMRHSGYKMSALEPMIAWNQQRLHPALRPSMIPVESLRFQDGGDIPLTTDLILTARDDVLDGKGGEFIADYQRSFDGWLAANTDSSAARSAAKTAKAEAKARGEKPVDVAAEKGIGLRGFNFVEAMLPGTPLQFWMRVGTLSDAQFGLLLLTVMDWANANVIGGSSARGFGRFNAALALYDDAREVTPSIFNVSDHATTYTLADSLSKYVKAAQDALSSLTVGELETVYPSKPLEAPKASGTDGGDE